MGSVGLLLLPFCVVNISNCLNHVAKVWKPNYNNGKKIKGGFLMLIVERVKQLMEAQHLNQKQLAEKANITEASLSKYLKGTREPRNDVVFNIAKSLNVTVDYLLGNDNPNVGNFEEAVQLLTRSKSQLSDEERIKLINILLEK